MLHVMKGGSPKATSWLTCGDRSSWILWEMIAFHWTGKLKPSSSTVTTFKYVGAVPGLQGWEVVHLFKSDI